MSMRVSYLVIFLHGSRGVVAAPGSPPMRQANGEVPPVICPALEHPVSSPHKTPTVLPSLALALSPLPWMTELPPASLLLPALPLCVFPHGGQSDSLNTDVRLCES